MELEFSRKIFENTQILDFLKIRPVEAELVQVVGGRDGQT
jgi:hypothetical protein